MAADIIGRSILSLSVPFQDVGARAAAGEVH